MPKISCFLPFIDEAEGLQTIHSLQNLDEVSDIHLIGNPCQTSSLRQMADEAQAPYILLYTKRFDLQLGYYALTRMLTVAEDSNASMVYADHRIQLPDGTVEAHPLIDYQLGSVRDDFSFGSLTAKTDSSASDPLFVLSSDLSVCSFFKALFSDSDSFLCLLSASCETMTLTLELAAS